MGTNSGFKKVINSLRVRIIISAMLLTLVLLPLIGITLNNAFEQQVRENVKEQLNAYFYSILSVTEFENGQLLMPEVLLDNQFNVINSGHYALISNTSQSANVILDSANTGELSASNSASIIDENLLWFSNSFLGSTLNETLPSPSVGEEVFSLVTMNETPHFIYSYSVRFDLPSNVEQTGALAPNITLHILKDVASVEQQLAAFSQQLWTWFLVIIAVLVLIQLFWLGWTLKPLARFSEELKLVQEGSIDNLSLHYPNELQDVAKQLNALLSNEKKQRERYRNALSDLAHSLKTPLAVIQSQQDLSEASMEYIQQIDRTIEHQMKRAQSAGSQAWHKGVEVEPICHKLKRSLTKIYPDINISFVNKADTTQKFYGDETDLIEVLGNLLDNACKAAQKEVFFTTTVVQNQLHFVVEDDGIGLSLEQKTVALERGRRLDTYDKGHGIGLAIVQDILASYDGKLTINSSSSLGGAKFTIAFNMLT